MRRSLIRSIVEPWAKTIKAACISGLSPPIHINGSKEERLVYYFSQIAHAPAAAEIQGFNAVSVEAERGGVFPGRERSPVRLRSRSCALTQLGFEVLSADYRKPHRECEDVFRIGWNEL